MNGVKVFEPCWKKALHMILLRICKAILMAVCFFYVFSQYLLIHPRIVS